MGNMSLDDFEASVVSALKVPVGDKGEDELFCVEYDSAIKEAFAKTKTILQR